MAAWVWLNAHGVGIAGSKVGGLTMAMQNVEFISNNPELHALRVVPLFTSVLAVLLVTASMGGVSRDRHILENTVYGIAGYVVAGLGVVVVSEARPGITLIVVLLAVVLGALYIGSVMANSLPIPAFAVVGLGGLFGLGLFILFAAGAVLAVAVPLGKAALGGGVAAMVALWVATNIG